MTGVFDSDLGGAIGKVELPTLQKLELELAS